MSSHYNEKFENIPYSCYHEITWSGVHNLMPKKKNCFHGMEIYLIRLRQGTWAREVGTPTLTCAQASRFFHHTLWSPSMKLYIHQFTSNLLHKRLRVFHIWSWECNNIYMKLYIHQFITYNNILFTWFSKIDLIQS